MQDFHGHDTYVRAYKFPTEVAALYSDLGIFLKELENCNCVDRLSEVTRSDITAVLR